MSLIYVGLPVLQHTRRFHFDKGRRWNVMEHLVLQALAQRGRSAGELAKDGDLPRRVALEILIRLMRAGWVELRSGTSEVTFHATRRGKIVASDDELPAVTERLARGMSYAIDTITGSIFRRRDLTLVWPNEWRARTEGRRAIEITSPQLPIKDPGYVSSLLGILFGEDERLVRVDVSDRPPAARLAMFIVRNQEVEGLSANAAPALRQVLVDAARQAPMPDANGPVRPTVSIPPVQIQSLRPERRTMLRQEDYILGGTAHQSLIDTALRKARQHVVIYSTFLDRNKFEQLLPAFRVAAGRGCRVDILWGQTTAEEGYVKSLREAEAIQARLRETGLAGPIEIHLFSTRSHAKILIADDGAGNTHAIVGSCNWLYSAFDSFEASIRLRDPRLVGDVLYEVAELARPRDGQLPELTVRLAQIARDLERKPPVNGSSRIRILTGEEHDDCVLQARDRAKKQITVVSHRLGVTAKPAIIIPAAAAVRARNVDVQLYYGRPSGPVEQADAAAASWEFKERGVRLVAVQRPRIHAKLLLWDDDHAVISSLNWLSADTAPSNPRGEIGVALSGANAADYLRTEFERARA